MALTLTPKTVGELLGKARNRVRQIGIELEGGWKELPPDVELVHDGSVMFANQTPVPDNIRTLLRSERTADRRRGLMMEEAFYYEVGKTLPKYKGELPSPPLDPKAFPKWVGAYYPSHVNETCGLHVHMSFNTKLTYQRLMTPLYEDAVVEWLKVWAREQGLHEDHPIWKRLNGENDYCRLGRYCADQQALARQKGRNRDAPVNRYTAIHYAYGLHGTIECRILPMMEDAGMAVRAIQRLLDITNAFILTQIKKEVMEREEIVDDGMGDGSQAIDVFI